MVHMCGQNTRTYKTMEEFLKIHENDMSETQPQSLGSNSGYENWTNSESIKEQVKESDLAGQGGANT